MQLCWNTATTGTNSTNPKTGKEKQRVKCAHAYRQTRELHSQVEHRLSQLQQAPLISLSRIKRPGSQDFWCQLQGLSTITALTTGNKYRLKNKHKEVQGIHSYFRDSAKCWKGAAHPQDHCRHVQLNRAAPQVLTCPCQASLSHGTKQTQDGGLRFWSQDKMSI